MTQIITEEPWEEMGGNLEALSEKAALAARKKADT